MGNSSKCGVLPDWSMNTLTKLFSEQFFIFSQFDKEQNRCTSNIRANLPVLVFQDSESDVNLVKCTKYSRN